MNVYPFIEAEKAGQHNVKRACELLEVSRSAYYARNEQSARARVVDDRDFPQGCDHVIPQLVGPG